MRQSRPHALDLTDFCELEVQQQSATKVLNSLSPGSDHIESFQPPCLPLNSATLALLLPCDDGKLTHFHDFVQTWSDWYEQPGL